MNKITIEMPLVSACSVNQCAYNRENNCHARAITIGDAMRPGCDSFLAAAEHTHMLQYAGIGACKMGDCKFNEDLECTADSVNVGLSANNANCLTYQH